MPWCYSSALALATCLVGAADAPAAPQPSNQELLEQLERSWDTVVATFWSPRTSLFYVTPPAQVPSAAQYARREPNIHAGGTGGEDCAMFGGILLSAMCDRFEVTGDPATGDRARQVYQGLRLLATVHGEPGFIARGVCVEDGKSVYPGSSRDQFTNVVHGLWRYHRSAMSTAAERQEIRDILGAVADKMAREVTAENDFSFRFLGGVPDNRRVSKMWHVYVHEAARLPMFYAAAWDAGRREEHRQHWREYAAPAVKQSLTFATTPPDLLRRWVPAYSVIQMQVSLEVLLALEPEAALAGEVRRAMREVAEIAEHSPVYDLAKRSGRERAEVIEGQLLSPDYTLSAKHEGYLRQSIARLDASRDPGAVYTLLGAYWRARRAGQLKP